MELRGKQESVSFRPVKQIIRKLFIYLSAFPCPQNTFPPLANHQTLNDFASQPKVIGDLAWPKIIRHYSRFSSGIYDSQIAKFIFLICSVYVTQIYEFRVQIIFSKP